MSKKKIIMSAILSAALLTSAVLPVSAAEVAATDSGATLGTQLSSEGDPSAFSWDNATVYFLLTDRFKNGNTSNDHSYGRATDASGSPLSGWDTAPGTFHGGDFKGITQAIEEGYFNDLGVNAIWLSAPYEQLHGYCDSGKGYAHYSYHGYYVLDYTETDKNFGTAEEFQELVDTAHEHGIRIVMDIVMNHAGYNTVKDMEEFNFGTLLEGASEFKYRLDGVSSVNDHIDFQSSAADWGRWWGNDWIRSGLPGYTEDGDGSELTQSLTGLPDFRTEATKSVSIPPLLNTKWTQEGTLNDKLSKYGSSNTVTGYISSWLADWVRTYGVDGFRCDTAKHVDKPAWNQLKTACVAALKDWRNNNQGKVGADWTDDFWMTGEAWDHGVVYDTYYTEGGFDSMINFDTCGGGALASGGLAGKYSDYAGAINTKDDFNALSFLSSHDEVLANQSQDMYYMGSAFLLLPGAVQIYYGDESGRGMVPGLAFDGYGGSGHSLRSDMNWNNIDEALLAHWQKVGTFRNNHIAVGAGANVSLTASDGVAFGRTYDKNGISDKVVGVVGAGSNSDVTIDVSEIWQDNTSLMNWYDEQTYDVVNGKVTVNSGEHGTILLEQGEPDPVKARVTGEAKFDTTQDVTVTLEGVDSAVFTIDGIKKLTVRNGDTVTIGDAAYPGDTVEITLTYMHPEKGEVTKKFSFKKNGNTGGYVRSDNAIVHVYANDLTSPNIYAWTGDGATATEFLGAWPGAALSAKDDDGWYIADLETTDKFNVIVNAGGGQSDDVKSLQGETWVVVDSSFKVTTYTDKKAALKAVGMEVPESDFEALKLICKEIKLLDTAGYSRASYGAAMAKVEEADVLIAQGEDQADPAAVTAIYREVVAAREALVMGDDNSDTDTDITVDKTVLKSKIDEAEGLLDGTGGTVTQYHDDLLQAVSTAKSVYNKADATQEEVDAQVDALTEAIRIFREAIGGSDTDTETDTASDTDTDTTTDTDSESDTETDTDTPVINLGDVNGDGKVNLKDASLIQRYALELTSFTNEQKAAADFNNDGKVNLKDASTIQRHALLN